VADLQPVLSDLTAESDDLDALVSTLPDEGWAQPTPAEGWTIAHQIAHLAWTDDLATLAATDPVVFQAELQRIVAAVSERSERTNVIRAWPAERAQRGSA
jgi:uncharacterized protein (TIGR03083 family)